MSNKLLGYPCTLAVDATPGSYTTIAAVLDVDFPSVQTDAQDFASRDSSSKREYTGGLRDGGELTFDVLYDPDDATHDTSAGLVAIALARTTKHWQLTMSDAAPATQWNFSGFIKAFKPKAPLNGALRASVTVKTTWAPAVVAADAPLASDGFGSAFGVTDGLGGGTGGDGVTWDHTTWSVSGGKAINTPGAGSELLANTTFDANATGWTAVNATLTSIAGGQSNNALEVKSTTGTGGNAYGYQGVSGPVVGDWLLALIYHKNGTQTGSMRLASTSSGADIKALTVQSDSAWTQKALSGMALGANSYLRLSVATGVLNDTTLYDTVSLKKLNLADMFASIGFVVADVAVQVNLVVPAGLDGGLVLNLDSVTNPQNFVLVRVDRSGGVVTAVKYVAGVPTTLFSTAITYVSGATLKATKSGTSYHVYYNNISVNTATVTDAGIVNNARHGLFSPYSTVTLDNFVVYAN